MATGVQMGVREAPSGVSVWGLPDPSRGRGGGLLQPRPEAAQQFGALVAVLADCRDACILAPSSVAPIQGELTAR